MGTVLLMVRLLKRLNTVITICLLLASVQPVTAQFSGGTGRGESVCYYESPYSPMYFGGRGRGENVCSFYSPSAPYYSGGKGRGDAICSNYNPIIPLFEGSTGRGDAICYEINDPLSIFSGGNGRGDAFCFSDEMLLPITLDYFNVHCWNNEVTISWATLSEKDNDYFSIETSIDGNSWIPLDTIFGAGNSSTYNAYKIFSYAERDNQYYRLSQTDYDGTKVQFDPVLSQCENDPENEPEIYPNPNNGKFTIRGFGASAELAIFDATGKLVLQTNLYDDISEIDLSIQQPGMYLLKIVTSSKTHTKRAIIKP